MKFHKTDNGRMCKTFKADCVIRSVSLATDQNYKQTFEELMALGLEVGAYPNHNKVWIRYLEDRGFVKNKPPRLNGKLIKPRIACLPYRHSWAHGGRVGHTDRPP